MTTIAIILGYGCMISFLIMVIWVAWCYFRPNLIDDDCMTDADYSKVDLDEYERMMQ